MIKDQFTYREITRQRRYQLRQRAKGCCYTCGSPSGGHKHCPSCKVKHSQRVKVRRKLQKELDVIRREREKLYEKT